MSANASEYYRIVAVDDSYHDTGKVLVKIQLIGSSKTFDLPVKELYQATWLNSFCKEDIAHIAALYTAENTNNLDIIQYFPLRQAANKPSIVIVGMIFSALLILSNLVASKVVQYGSIIFPAGLVFFPLTYIFDDILTEVYGFKVSRRVIWTALLANILVILGTWLTVYLHPAPFWHHQTAYQTVFDAVPRVFVASMLGYLAGEFTNSVILAKLKVLTSGRHLWFRAITSTAVGVGIDTILFSHIAFFEKIPYHSLWTLIASMYSIKVLYEIAAIPLTYRITAYLKRKDYVDQYDFETIFNPFSLKLE